MPLFGRKEGRKEIDPRAAGAEARRHWTELSAQADPVASDRGAHLREGITAAQIAHHGDPEVATVLAAFYLLAASLPCSRTTLSDPIVRFAGLAAVAVGRHPRPSEELAAWFRRVRGRCRGSVFVPRDVEYAFSGMYQAMDQIALDPKNVGRVGELLDHAMRDARDWAASQLVDADPAFASANAAARRERAAKLADKVARFDWAKEDLAAVQAIAGEMGTGAR